MTPRAPGGELAMRAAPGTNLRVATPPQLEMDAARSLAQAVFEERTAAAAAREFREGPKFRVLAVEPLPNLAKRRAPDEGPRRFRAIVYDYTENRAYSVTAAAARASGARAGRAFRAAARSAVVKRLPGQPLPSPEELEDAFAIVRRDPTFGPLIARGALSLYTPMPPVVEPRGARRGAAERRLHVGLLPTRKEKGVRHQIVAVNLIQRRVEVYPKGHPPAALAAADVCGPPEAACDSPPRGTAGEMDIAWPAAAPVWRFRAVRPAASSGTRGSGVELRFVDYKGQRVLHQAHVPILNVQYEDGACGPYRDWQYDEHCFQAEGTDVGPGFRWCTTPPKTLCEAGSDEGNFTGVAIYEDGDELVLVSEMTAGWYRYISEWRLHRDGTIRPRFRFGAVDNSCVCHAHVHHCYWRLDFDVAGTTNLVEEFNRAPSGSTSWRTLRTEAKRNRDPARERRWRVRSPSGLSYEIVPGPNDGRADAYGRGDMWLLRFRASEIDDGVDITTGPRTPAEIDRFVNQESVERQDVVVWYAGHFLHHDPSSEGAHSCGELGPTLRRVELAPLARRAASGGARRGARKGR